MTLRRLVARCATTARASTSAAAIDASRATRVRRHETSAVKDDAGKLPGQVDAREKAKFEADAALWWNEGEGPFAALRGLKILDVGCGGGILAESLARLGAQVTAIDAGAANIAIARAHAELDPDLVKNLKYEAVTAEELVERGETFDCVTSLEVIEHVTDPLEFTKSIAKLVKPKGALFVSTINRTARSFAFAILAAERVLGLVPPGTHQFSKFLTPGEIAMMAGHANCEMVELAGMVYDPLRNKWSLSSDTQINFIAHCVKSS